MLNKIVTEYKFPQKIYFNAILKKIAKIITTNRKNAIVLDYGCGSGQLKKFVKEIDSSINVIGYDIDSNISEIENPFSRPYDIYVFNHVLMYINKKEILVLIKKIKSLNKKALIIIGSGKQNYLSKFGSIMLNKNAHDKTISSLESQIKIIETQVNIISRENIYLMTEIVSCKLK
jgi:SAM-dependent methyltransferase